jgi:hypothetical protein
VGPGGAGALGAQDDKLFMSTTVRCGGLLAAAGGFAKVAKTSTIETGTLLEVPGPDGAAWTLLSS